MVRMGSGRCWGVLGGAGAWILGLAVLAAQQGGGRFAGTLDQHPAINYAAAPVSDRVARAFLQAGAPRPARDARFGYLLSVLAALDVPVASQVLVFSKTGVQQQFTGPSTPRAFYFNDEVVVGYIPGAPMLELASHDPRHGVRFYSLAQDPQPTPAFDAPERCLTCHLSANSLDVPGLLVRSMFTAPDGRTRPEEGSFLIDHRSPFDTRWGGWYVTGTPATMAHMGEAPGGRMDPALYPAASSDIVALMVFDHQSRAINLITRLAWETRVAEAEQRADFSTGDLRDLSRDLAEYLLFVDEPPLPARVAGPSAFAEGFSARGPRDTRGRALRDFDLQARLFKYRCSYMVYSPAFDALPASAKAAVYGRMKEVLAARGPDAGEILSETLKGF